MVNEKLMKVATQADFIRMGFKEENDGSGDPRGIDYNFRTDKFHILIDPWFEVKICRLNPDSDFITLHIEDLQELQSVLDFVYDEPDEDNRVKSLIGFLAVDEFIEKLKEPFEALGIPTDCLNDDSMDQAGKIINTILKLNPKK